MYGTCIECDHRTAQQIEVETLIGLKPGFQRFGGPTKDCSSIYLFEDHGWFANGNCSLV